jgi:hypothetical protein
VLLRGSWRDYVGADFVEALPEERVQRPDVRTVLELLARKRDLL